MVDDTPEEVPEFIRKLRDKKGQAPEQKLDVGLFAPDLIPEVTPSDRSDTDVELDQVLSRVDILDAYQKWCGKMTPLPGSKRESVMISCPDPAHPDANPSAWCNLDSNTWFCGGCQRGGDIYDIAAMHFGFGLDYKNKRFPELRRLMASDLGYVVRKTLGGTEYIEEPITEVAKAEVAPPEPSNVVKLFENDDTYEDELREQGIRIDWEEIIPPQTFMWEWMTACTIDDLPHEYYFWLGMQAIAFAAGTEQLLDDFQQVKPNLFVCLYGKTGSGKSRALVPYVRLLEDALPYDEDPFQSSSGTRILSSPASAEALLKMFQREISDPSSMQTVELAQVRGLLRVEEFASFIARASRSTNPMKETLIELYDVLGRDMRHTSIGGGTVTAREPYCQMVTTTQPAAIHEFLRRTDAHSGFLNRWVFATGYRRRDRIAYGGVHIDIAKATNYLSNLKAFTSTPRLMTLTGDALVAWEEFFHATIVPLHDTTDESMFSRIDLVLKKLILLLTLNEHEVAPTGAIVRKACSLYSYLRQTYMMFSTDISHNDYEECRMRIVVILKEIEKSHKRPATLREIVRRLNSKFDNHKISQVLKTMIELDQIEEIIEKGQRGPGTKKYRHASD